MRELKPELHSSHVHLLVINSHYICSQSALLNPIGTYVYTATAAMCIKIASFLLVSVYYVNSHTEVGNENGVSTPGKFG